MPQPEWEALATEVHDLQVRVARMELAIGLSAGAAIPAPAAVEPPQPPALLDSPTSVLPILGRGLLGLAGAYLLRALTESGTLSSQMGVAVGLIYAMLWLVSAVRTRAPHRLEAAVYSLTSVLVLSPLLFEATTRFHTIST